MTPTIPNPTDEALRARVAAGIAWLDQHAPGWRARVDLEALDMAWPDTCVWGQAIEAYEDDEVQATLGDGDPVDYGFNVEGCPYDLPDYWTAEAQAASSMADHQFARLTRVWRELLSEGTLP